MATKEELKKKRLQAMDVVGARRADASAMYDRVIAYGDKVSEAIQGAETAHIGAMNADIADLKDMEDEMAEFAQAAPTVGGTGGKAPPPVTVKPATAALDALQKAQPGAMKLGTNDGAEAGDAYVGTSPPNH